VIFAIMCIFQIIFIIGGKKTIFIEKILFFCFGLMLFIMSAFRFHTGYDYENYYTVYEVINMVDMKHIGVAGVEYGYAILNRICANYRILIIICAYIGVFLKLKVFEKYKDHIFLILIMYYSGLFLNFDMGVIRQGISMSIMFLGTEGLYKKDEICIQENTVNTNKIKFILCLATASLFHISALVFIPLYFLRDKKLSRRTIYFCVAIGSLCVFFNISDIFIFIAEKLGMSRVAGKLRYYSGITDSMSIIYSLIKRVVILVFFVEYYERHNIEESRDILSLNAYFLSVLIMEVFYSIDILGGRGVHGLYFYQAFVFAAMVKNTKKISTKLIIFLIMAVLSYKTMTDLIGKAPDYDERFIPYKMSWKDV